MTAFERLLMPGWSKCPNAGAGKKWPLQAASHCRTEATLMSVFTIVLCANIKCALQFGVPISQFEGPSVQLRLETNAEILHGREHTPRLSARSTQV